MDYGTLKTLHVLSRRCCSAPDSAARFICGAPRHGDAAQFAFVARQVVLADWLFTATAVVFQPLSGWLLCRTAGHPLDAGWLQASYGHLLAGACCCRWSGCTGCVIWPVTPRVCGSRCRHAGITAVCLWFVLGWPAFGAVVLIFWLMVNRPGFRA